ncbi:MAG: 2-C-methyl-D-erythritol 4-phosphate cytidylyltransferase [Methylophilaceae bacterium]
MAQYHVIIPAAGTGNRMASALPKQYSLILGQPMILHCLQTFIDSPRIASIHLALNPDDTFWHCLKLEPNSRLHLHNTGGSSRALTVLNTLNAISVDEDDWVLVHDAARPGLDESLLNHLLDALQDDAVGGLLALPLADTLKRSNQDGRSEATIPREHLWQAQTPQMFRYVLLKQALIQNGGHATDEAFAIEALGLQPKLVVGSLRNMKVTYPQDVPIVEALMRKDVI